MPEARSIVNFTDILMMFSHGLPYHAEVRWLSRDIVLKRFSDDRGEIVYFMKIKWKPLVQLQSPEWLLNLAFVGDITVHINNQKRMLQGNEVVTQYYDNIRGFKSELALWESQLSINNPANFPCLKDLCNAGSAENLDQYRDKISSLF